MLVAVISRGHFDPNQHLLPNCQKTTTWVGRLQKIFSLASPRRWSTNSTTLCRDCNVSRGEAHDGWWMDHCRSGSGLDSDRQNLSWNEIAPCESEHGYWQETKAEFQWDYTSQTLLKARYPPTSLRSKMSVANLLKRRRHQLNRRNHHKEVPSLLPTVSVNQRQRTSKVPLCKDHGKSIRPIARP